MKSINFTFSLICMDFAEIHWFSKMWSVRSKLRDCFPVANVVTGSLFALRALYNGIKYREMTYDWQHKSELPTTLGIIMEIIKIQCFFAKINKIREFCTEKAFVKRVFTTEHSKIKINTFGISSNSRFFNPHA